MAYYLVYRTSKNLAKQLATATEEDFDLCRTYLYTSMEEAENKAKEIVSTERDDNMAFIAEVKTTFSKVPREIEITELNLEN